MFAGVMILFAPLNVFCVAAAEIEPHDKAPVASLNKACEDDGKALGSVRR